MKWIQRVAIGMAALGMCVPQMVFAAAPQPAAPVVRDVQLHQNGALLGQVVNPENVPQPGVKLALRSAGKPLAETKSGKDGYFAFAGLNNGVYEIVAPEGVAMYRVWTKTTAPPAAQQGAVVVNGKDTVVRGQHRMHGFRNLMANPWFVAAVIATAVAVPVAIHNSKDSSSP